MDLTHWLWLGTAAYGIHALEEFILNWRDWARAVIGLPVSWQDFYVVNSLVVVLGVVAANLAVASPPIALGFAALMIVNGLFFHIAPFIKTRGRFSPGLFTAIILLLPIGLGCYVSAHGAGLLDAPTIIASAVIGAALMATPIILLKLALRPYFKQDPG
jgi:hypothetical protein